MKIPVSLGRLALLLPSVYFAVASVLVMFDVDPDWLAVSGLVALAVAVLLLPLVSRQSLARGYLSLALLAVPVLLALAVSMQPRMLERPLRADPIGLDALTSPLTLYRIHAGDYPSTAQGLDALIHCPQGLESKWHGPYLDDSKKLLDPWGHPFQYRYPGTHNTIGYDLWSLGPDGQPDTADDIGNWAPAIPRIQDSNTTHS